MSDLEDYTVVELKEECRRRQIVQTGLKQDIIDRIRAFDAGEAVEASPRRRARSPASKSAKSSRTAARRSRSPRSRSAKKSAPTTPRATTRASSAKEEKEEIEFGGPIGSVFIMIMSHLTLYYLWISWKYYDAALLYPSSFADFTPWAKQMWGHVVAGASPNKEAFVTYWVFLFGQAFAAWIIPGLQMKGLPIKHLNGKRLVYNCNGIFTWYLTIVVVLGLHFSGVWSLTSVFHNFGPIMSVAMLTQDFFAILLFVIAFVTKTTHRMSGNFVYDFFMGASLNPRIGSLDIKMLYETRVAWVMLFLLTIAAAAYQHESTGAISPQMWFMILAHFLYTNAVHKGEECIPTTWDIFHEKFGWMLIFWNGAGVPFVYTFQSWFIATHSRSEIGIANHWVIALVIVLLTAYYIWDTAQRQRNSFRMKLNGTFVERSTFPQFSAGIMDPATCRYIKTKAGSLLLTDGFWAHARKLHYTCDVVMALTWGLVCGTTHVLPYFYVMFFVLMITHRTTRDLARCEKKYGDDWIRYKKEVPYLFVPGLI